MFNRCTLFELDDLGLIIIQEHFNEKIKARWWGAVDPWLAYDIFNNPNFGEFLYNNAAKCDENKLYPVFTVRKVMYALKMKPLKKAFWEEF